MIDQLTMHIKLTDQKNCCIGLNLWFKKNNYNSIHCYIDRDQYNNL